MYFWSNKKDLNQNLIGIRKSNDFWGFGEKRHPTYKHAGWRIGIFKNVVLRVATSFSIQIFFIGLTDVWTRWKHDFWIGGRF